MRKFLFAICAFTMVACGATAFDGGYENPPAGILSAYTMDDESPMVTIEYVTNENPFFVFDQSFATASPGPDIDPRYNANTNPETESVKPQAALSFDRWRTGAEIYTNYYTAETTIAAPQEPDEAQPFHQGRDGCSY